MSRREKGIVKNHPIEPVKKINARQSIKKKKGKKENLVKELGILEARYQADESQHTYEKY